MHWFIVPALDGSPTGGTVFNRRLITALERGHVACLALPLADAFERLVDAAAGDCVWVDSLFLADVPALARVLPRGAQLGLVLHYLPSLVGKGAAVARSDLGPAEAAALQAASCYLVTSAFMRSQIRQLTARRRPVLWVEPGRPTARPSRVPEPPVRATMVANLVPGKGVEELLGCLAEQARSDDDFVLAVIGGGSFDADYALRCRLRAGDPRLRQRVLLVGERAPDETSRELAASNLLVSASTMESYGMALAEARGLGIPIVARPGGNVASLVTPAAGGELAPDAHALAAAFLRLVRDPDEHRRRIDRAQATALPPRPWSMAAQELTAQVAHLLRPPGGPARDRGRESETRCR